MPRRLSPLDGRQASGPGVTLVPTAPRRRLILRARGDAVGAAGAALGLELPVRPKTSARQGGVSALWLGPDEWLILDGSEAAESLAASDGPLAEALAVVSGIAVVDISHRNVGVVVDGPAAEAVVAAGCPQDIRPVSFPLGACSRTVLSKAEIVLWRTGEQRFEIECWRSFADYVWTFLAEASRAPAV
ncbi:sarcosine oxidase subunit gamma [Aurantimonas litoralis]|nr:sarcosine oxidase subunit gamma [Aurantimonas litoralis]